MIRRGEMRPLDVGQVDARPGVSAFSSASASPRSSVTAALGAFRAGLRVEATIGPPGLTDPLEPRHRPGSEASSDPGRGRDVSTEARASVGARNRRGRTAEVPPQSRAQGRSGRLPAARTLSDVSMHRQGPERVRTRRTHKDAVRALQSVSLGTGRSRRSFRAPDPIRAARGGRP
jgi:hypothetical protein